MNDLVLATWDIAVIANTQEPEILIAFQGLIFIFFGRECLSSSFVDGTIDASTSGLTLHAQAFLGVHQSSGFSSPNVSVMIN